MSISSTLDLNIEVRAPDRRHSPVSSPTTPAEKSARESAGRSNASPSAANSRPRLGDAVRHSRFGDGQVLANWPDGTVLVRFAKTAKNRLVYPSFLELVGGPGTLR